MAIVVTGGAGFIAVNLVRRFVAAGRKVVAFDNFSRGRREHLREFAGNALVEFDLVDCADGPQVMQAMRRWHERDAITEVWHLAANSDIPAGVANAQVDLRDTFMTTFNLLEAAKSLRVGTFAFASSSAIYGDLGERAISEDAGPLLPISNYGAMKLASEAAISAAAESHLDAAFIFRFPNVIGVPATHGVIYDFVKRLKDRPDRLDVLGDGTQRKSYLHAEDLVDAMCFIREKAGARMNCYNIGPDDEGVTVRFIAEETVAAVSPGAAIFYGSGSRGWIGDVPRFRYSIAKLKELGWEAGSDSATAVRRAIRQIAAAEGK